jgi:hypothetical protein
MLIVKVVIERIESDKVVDSESVTLDFVNALHQRRGAENLFDAAVECAVEIERRGSAGRGEG